MGTRPEIIKLSPVIRALADDWTLRLIHTGQHFDDGMDGVFFRQLALPPCDHRLDRSRRGQHPAADVGQMIADIGDILASVAPALVLVQGDTNSALAGGLAAVKSGVRLAHVEAGCRSFNRRMPEETNRVLLDHVSDWLFAPDLRAKEHLAQEGLHDRVRVVGDTGVEALRWAAERLQPPRGASSEPYALVTVHRQESTSVPAVLTGIVEGVNRVAQAIHCIVLLHPRTRKAMSAFGLEFRSPVDVRDPADYFGLVELLQGAHFVMTDSGGLQIESAVLGVPCLVLRHETEWTVAVDAGKNVLVGTTAEGILDAATGLLSDPGLRQRMSRSPLPVGFEYPSGQLIAQALGEGL